MLTELVAFNVKLSLLLACKLLRCLLSCTNLICARRR